MKKNSGWFRVLLVLAVAFVSAAILHGLLQHQWFSGMGLQVAFLAAVLGFIVLTWDEQGFFYALAASLILCVIVAVVGSYPPSLIGRLFLTLFYFVLFGGLMFLGDWVSRRNLVLRAIVSLVGGVMAGVIMIYLLPLIHGMSQARTFLLRMQGNLVNVIETTGGVAVAILLARLVSGNKKDD